MLDYITKSTHTLMLKLNANIQQHSRKVHLTKIDNTQGLLIQKLHAADSTMISADVLNLFIGATQSFELKFCGPQHRRSRRYTYIGDQLETGSFRPGWMVE